MNPINKQTRTTRPARPIPDQQVKDKLIGHRQFIDKHGQDMPETSNWKWEENTMQERDVSAK
jgi:phosphoketolase